MMLAKIEGKKLFFSEYTQEELAKVKDLLSWEGDDYHPSETLLLEENGQFYTFWGLYSLLAKKIKLEVVNPREDEVYELPSIENTLLQGITLHDYQVAAIRKCLALKRGIVSIPTAGGKTEICIGILEVLFRSFSIDKALIVVPTFGLAEQFYERFLLRGFPGDFVGRIHGECRDTDKPITIGVINSLIRGYRESPEIRKIIEESQAVFFDECIDGEHYVATQFGYKKLKTLNVGDEVITPFGRSKINKIWKTKKLSYEVTLRSGKKFIVSKDHLVPTFTKKEWQEHQDNRFATLKIDKIENSHNLLFFKETINFDDDFDPFAYFLGWFIGDGTLYPSGCRFSFRKDIDTIRGIFLRIGFPFSENKNSRGDTNFTFNAGIFNELKDLGFKEGSKCLTCEIPKKYRFNKWTIRGLFEAEGAFTGNRIVLDMVSKKCIDQISSFLFCNGIMNTVHSYPSKNPKHNTRHRIAIFGDDIERFYRLIGNSFYQKQNNRLATLQRRLRPMVKFDPIVEMKEIGERELYDISLDDKNKLFIVEGYLFHNCHHIQASTWTELALGVKNDEYLLCFSGTPFHADDADDILDTSGDALTFGLAGKPIFELRQKYLVDKGIIARPFVFFKSLPGQLSKYPGRFNNIYKTHIVNNSTRNELIVKFAKRFQEIDFPTLILVQRKEHALNLMEMMKDPKAIFVSGGANAVSYDSNGMVEEFKIDYNVFRSNFEDGQWNILIATQVFDEAIDIPSIQSLIMAGAGRSKIKQLQRLGRGVRKKKDKINHAYIVDFIDRGHVYLFAQYKKRRQRYEDLEIEIIADEMEFNRLLYWHKEELKNDLVHGWLSPI